MSEELQGQVPALETTQIDQFSDAFVLIEMTFSSQPIIFPANILVGNLAGIEINDDTRIDKVDVRVPITAAYSVLSHVGRGNPLTCATYRLILGADVTEFKGNFDVKSPRIMDFDHGSKMCVLALDLVRRRV